MKSTHILGLSLFLLMWFAQALAEEEKPSVTAYRYGAMGRLNEMQGKNAEALDYFNQSLALVPDPIILSNRGDLKKKLKDIPGAIADYDAAIAMKPADLDILYGNRALMKHQSGDLDGAIADYSQVIHLHPNEAIYYNNRGYARIAKGDRAGAMADYAKAVALEPKTVTYRENLADAKRVQGDFAGAITEYDKIVALDPENPLSYYHRGNLKQLNGSFTGAIKDYNKIIELLPESWGGYLQRGSVRQAQGDLKAALVDYEKAVSVTKDHVGFGWAYREIVLRQLKRGTPDAEMSKIAAKGKDGFPNNVGHYLSGAMNEAEFIAKAGQDNAEQCAAFYYVGMTKLLAGDKATARKFFEQSVATNGTDVNEFVLARAELSRLIKPK